MTPPPPRRRRIALPTGLTYHLLEWGAGDHTLVLVHGFLDLAWGWAEVAARLAERYHVVAVDLRGHGDSDWIGAGGYYHFFDYVADLDQVVERVGRDTVSIAGHSMGGTIVAYWAGTRPSRPHRVALLEGLGPPEGGADLPARTRGWIDTWTTTERVPKVLASVDDAAARLRRHDPLLTAARALELAGHGTRAVDGGVSWKHDPLHLTQGPYPFRVDAAASYWRAVTAPVLYLDGAESRLRLPEPELARRLACFADARRVTVPGAGHMLMRHAPTAVADALAAHVER
ncbi:MAG: alpha/beta hydrolase [Myxococcales bacterium]|nr:alpha/beta hydrolase [Myxococcales bacterium]